MRVTELLDILKYSGSRNFLRGKRLRNAPAFGHVFRRAVEDCGLRGVYVLQSDQRENPDSTTPIPVVYVCEANSDEEADRIHRRVWNQDVVPFLILLTPSQIRLYSGFKYAASKPRLTDPDRGILSAIKDFSLAASALDSFQACSIDNGAIWRDWGSSVTPETRLDWTLLRNLAKLDECLQDEGLEARTAHALIGKYVFLWYLRHRKILSDRKLGEWEVSADDVFTRNATLVAFWSLVDCLEEWLNGSVFPLPASMRSKVRHDHLKLVAGAFSGDSPSGQLHLDFEAYDFSFIPIETLSVVYEQFLHTSKTASGLSSGRERGAYYTPIPLVNYVLYEMECRKPLRQGMRVLDPACGSGAFLVQCYRKLIEKTIRQTPSKRLLPTELRDLLSKHIFGIDSDRDACQVAELSLTLTLLDYVTPPDLSKTRFKLPALRDKNIFCSDAFDDSVLGDHHTYDWVVGNPPWKQVATGDKADGQEALSEWVANHSANHRSNRPIARHQASEAFAWRALDFVAPDGIVGLVLKSSSLFDKNSSKFRQAFFKSVKLHEVTNLANLRHVLFQGRSSAPASVWLYTPVQADWDWRDRTVKVYAPLLANQEANRPTRPRQRQDMWSLVVNAGEIRHVHYRDIIDGDILPWKLATWGSTWDMRLLRAVTKRFPTLEDTEKTGAITISEGLQLRKRHGGQSTEAVEHHPELAGKRRLNVGPLRRLARVLRFPEEAIEKVPPEEVYVRKGRFSLPYAVSKPPHVIVSAARNYAVYTNKFLIVPPRQIGIAGPGALDSFLKAIAAYLNSDFAKYHQFIVSPSFGVERDRATLDDLRSLPVPFSPETHKEVESLSTLYDRLSEVAAQGRAIQGGSQGLFGSETQDSDLDALLDKLNSLVGEYLRLDKRSLAIVHDLVHVRAALNDGRIGSAATGAPTAPEIRAYGHVLQDELNGFLGRKEDSHQVSILRDNESGVIQTCLVRTEDASKRVEVFRAGQTAGRVLQEARERLREQHAQWLYFDRSLRIYEGSCIYLMKPMQRMHWTRSQAMVDAENIIADTLQYFGD